VIHYQVKSLYLKVMQPTLLYGECVVLWYRRADFATLGYLHYSMKIFNFGDGSVCHCSCPLIVLATLRHQ